MTSPLDPSFTPPPIQSSELNELSSDELSSIESQPPLPPAEDIEKELLEREHVDTESIKSKVGPFFKSVAKNSLIYGVVVPAQLALYGGACLLSPFIIPLATPVTLIIGAVVAYRSDQYIEQFVKEASLEDPQYAFLHAKELKEMADNKIDQEFTIATTFLLPNLWIYSFVIWSTGKIDLYEPIDPKKMNQ